MNVNQPLKYINLYNAQIENIKDQLETLINDDTIVCQDNDRVITSRGIKNCYIIAKYGTETTYEANVFKNDDRQIVDHIKYKGVEIDPTQ